MKKFLIAIFLLGSVSLLSAGGVDKNSNQIFSLGDGYSGLISATSAAFSISLTSVNAVGTTTGKMTIYGSSATLAQLNSLGGATTHFFDLTISTSDTIFDVVNRGNEITNWTFAIPSGCYGLQLATGSASIRVDGEGTTDGLQYDVGGKATSVSTGATNTIYLNASLYLSQYFSPVKYQEYTVQGIYTDLAQGTTMYIYEGVTSTITNTLVDLPRTDVKTFEFPASLSLPISSQKAFEYQVKYGTWSVTSGATLGYSQILYYKHKN